MTPRLKLLRISREPRYNGVDVEEHTHNWYEFVYYINAEGCFTINGDERRIKNGRFMIIRPNVPHSERHRLDGMVFFCIFECDTELDSRVFDDDEEGTVRRLCESVAEEYFSPREYSERLLEVVFEELILRVMRWSDSESESARDIKGAAEYIERRFREHIDLHALAENSGFGYDYFHHLFKKKYGLSPKQYQMKCRIDFAKELLLSGRYNCTEVAYLSGFSDSAQFSLIFKRECGVTPSQYAVSRRF